MSSTQTRTVTTVDPETGDEDTFEVPMRVNGWVYSPDHPTTLGTIVWVDPHDDDRFVTMGKSGGHTWSAGLRDDGWDSYITSRTGGQALEEAKTLMMGNSTSSSEGDALSPAGGHTVTRALYDGSIRFMPEFTKKEAEYRPTHDDQFDESHDRCGSCIHFIEGGGCHFVQGDIDPGAYCEEFFADYGVFAHEHDDHVEVNAELVSPDWDFDERSIDEFVNDLEERLQQRRREMEANESEET